MPIAGLGDAAHTIDARRWSTKVYAAVMFIVFILTPAWTLGHLTRVVMDRAAVWNELQDPITAVRPACFMPIPWTSTCQADERARLPAIRADGSQRLSLADNRCDPRIARTSMNVASSCKPSQICAEKPERCRGVDWIPVWSSLAIILPTLAGWGGTLWLTLALWINRNRPEESTLANNKNDIT